MLGQVAGRELGRVLELAEAEFERLAAGWRRVKPRTSPSPALSTLTITPSTEAVSDGPSGSTVEVSLSRSAAPPVIAMTTTRTSANRFRVRRSTPGQAPGAVPAPAPALAAPVLPGA